MEISKLKELIEKTLNKFKIEGRSSDGWKLIDTMDIIIHIFQPEKRKFYDLEKMWSEPEFIERINV